MEAVELTARLTVAAQLAVLQAGHLPDEGDGGALTLAVHGLTPGGTKGAGGEAADQTQ